MNPHTQRESLARVREELKDDGFHLHCFLFPKFIILFSCYLKKGRVRAEKDSAKAGVVVFNLSGHFRNNAHNSCGRTRAKPGARNSIQFAHASNKEPNSLSCLLLLSWVYTSRKLRIKGRFRIQTQVFRYGMWASKVMF